MRPFLQTLLPIILICLAQMGWARERIPVGAYPFLPFVGASGGLTQDMLQVMNNFQTEYEFYLVPTSSNRRYRDMANGSFQMILFENIKWGWDSHTVDASKVFFQGDGEVYVARKAPGDRKSVV